MTNTAFNASVHKIDLSDNNAITITTQGRKVICYFSARKYENWRLDARSVNDKTDLGTPVGGWAGDWWLNTNSSIGRKIMLSQLEGL